MVLPKRPNRPQLAVVEAHSESINPRVSKPKSCKASFATAALRRQRWDIITSQRQHEEVWFPRTLASTISKQTITTYNECAAESVHAYISPPQQVRAGTCDTSTATEQEKLARVSLFARFPARFNTGLKPDMELRRKRCARQLRRAESSPALKKKKEIKRQTRHKKKVAVFQLSPAPLRNRKVGRSSGLAQYLYLVE